MDFQSVEIEHSNPSMGPHEVVTSYTLSTKDYKQELDEFLQSIKVNGRLSLGDYLRLLAEGPAAEAEEVRQAFKPDDLRSGATISALKFRLTEGKTLSLDDLRYYQLNGFRGSHFLNLLINKGHKYQSGAGRSPIAMEELKPTRLERPEITNRPRITPKDEEP